MQNALESALASLAKRNLLAALPFSTLENSVKRKPRRAFADVPLTIGEHILKRRLELGLSQTKVGDYFGVSHYNISLWELNKAIHFEKYMKKINKFLGYDPTRNNVL